jgi:anti-sigma B factor antagonist
MTATPAPLALGPELTIPFAAVTRDTLFDALHAQGGDLAIGLSGVTDVDSAGVQLLLATQRSLVERGDRMVLHAPSAPVRDALAVFGLSHLLQS